MSKSPFGDHLLIFIRLVQKCRETVCPIAMTDQPNWFFSFFREDTNDAFDPVNVIFGRTHSKVVSTRHRRQNIRAIHENEIEFIAGIFSLGNAGEHVEPINLFFIWLCTKARFASASSPSFWAKKDPPVV